MGKTFKDLKSFTMQPAKMVECRECGEKAYKSDMTNGLCPDCYMEASEQEQHERIERNRIREF